MADQACKSNNHSGFEGAYPGVALPSSNLEGTTEVGVPVLGATENSATTIARGRAIKRVNAWTAVLCGGLPALALGILFPTGLQKWLASFVVGLLWAKFVCIRLSQIPSSPTWNLLCPAAPPTPRFGEDAD